MSDARAGAAAVAAPAPAPGAGAAASALAALPQLPRDPGGPVFRAPWEARAFALAVLLSQRGQFAWSEFAAALAAELAAAAARGEPDDGSRYYQHWLAALEALLAARGLAPGAQA